MNPLIGIANSTMAIAISSDVSITCQPLVWRSHEYGGPRTNQTIEEIQPTAHQTAIRRGTSGWRQTRMPGAAKIGM